MTSAPRTVHWGLSATHGTVVVLPGRGEHPGIYQRLGTRLATEGYHVVATRVDQAADVIAAAEGPVVLLGSDTGAAAALALADIAIARVIAERLRARFVEVDGGHDILNDTTHDAAADEVVRFLGRVRADAVLVRA
ncbi:hypothetical protein CLV68_4372 [Actinokineospora cianjurensis]|uniref:Alpha/beta hydrolase family protein n=1 Tax=Actinokineospora cianjurensis TaxID=585224 RepID=A0A421B1X4_9PSEU|nr:hypothetical protein CLV68_4372 [Actinokineospora cianjurensis]